MNGTAATWSTWREVASVVVASQNLKKTISVAVIVGTAFFAMNQLGVIMAGRANALVWLKTVVTYLTPLFVSNCGVLSATHRPAAARPTMEVAP